MDYAIGGITIALLIVGIVEAAKEFGIEGKASRALVLVLGVVFVGLSEGIGKGLIPAEYVVWVEYFVTVVAGGLAAMGYYDLSKKFWTQEKQ